MRVSIDQDQLAILVAKVVEDYRDQRGEFELLPEQKAAESIEDDRDKALFFTFGMATDYLRPSEEHWRNMVALREDQRQFFEPSFHLEADRAEELSEVLKGFSYFRPNKDAKSWTRIARTLAREYESDPRNILKWNDYDAVRILRVLRDGDFPQFGGEKIGPVWVRLMSEEIRELNDIEQLTLPLDAPTRQVTHHLVDDSLTDDEIREFWTNFCAEYRFEPLVLDQVHWLLAGNWEWGESYLEDKIDEDDLRI